jgi:hypothetical protein
VGAAVLRGPDGALYLVPEDPAQPVQTLDKGSEQATGLGAVSLAELRDPGDVRTGREGLARSLDRVLRSLA